MPMSPRFAPVVALMAGILLLPACQGRPRVSFKELADDDPHIRADAALRLGQARAKDGVDSLIAVLDDPDELVRINVVRALGEIGETRATPALVPVADDTVSTVRLAVTQAFGMLKDPASVPTLRKLLNDEDDTVRIASARALGTIPGDASLEALMEVALQDENEMVRQHVVRVIGERRVREAIPRLERMLAAEAEIVRANSARALGDLGDPSSVPALERALEDPYFKVRSLAAHALGKIAAKDPQVQSSLAARLAQEDNGMVKVDLAWNLGLGGNRAHMDVLRDLLFKGDPEDVRAEAARALGEVGEAADVALLQRALGDKKGLVRQEAAKSMEKLKKS